MSNDRHNRTMLGISPFRLDEEEEPPVAAESIRATGERLAVAPVSLTDDDGWDVPDLAQVVARGPTPLSTTAIDDAPKLPTLNETSSFGDAADQDADRAVPRLGGHDGAVTGAVPRLSAVPTPELEEVGASTMMMSASALAGMLGDDPAGDRGVAPARPVAPVADAAVPSVAPVASSNPVPEAPPVAASTPDSDAGPYTAPLAPPSPATEDPWEVARRGGTVRLSAVDFHKLVTTGEQPAPMSADELAGSKHALGADDLTDSRVALPGAAVSVQGAGAAASVAAAPVATAFAAPATTPPPVADPLPASVAGPVHASVAAKVNDRRASEQRPMATTAPAAVAPSTAPPSRSPILIVAVLFVVLAAAGAAAFFVLARG